MRRIIRCALIVCLVSCTLARATQAQSPRPENVRDSLVAHWTDIGDKVIKLAEAFPEDKYDFRPAPGVRTFGEVLRHVGFWNLFVVKNARGEKADGSANELAKAEYPTKAAILTILKSSVADAGAELQKQPAALPVKMADLYVAFIGHSGEHYGQLVVYARLNGIVPPASR